MRRLIENALIYCSDERKCVRGTMTCADGKILSVDFSDDSCGHSEVDARTDAGGCLVFPGLVDVHTHGRAGFDFNFADEAEMKLMAKSYALAGTTSLFPTLASAPFDDLTASAEIVRNLRGKTSGAEFLGVHLEGRYLNPEMRGAHKEELLKNPDAVELKRFMASSGLPLHVSAALELDSDGSFAAAAKSMGATLGLAHTAATYAEAMEVFRMWNVSFTHLYNAMPKIHHRCGGAAVAGLCSDAYAELICDGLHVSSEMVSFTLKNKGLERLVLVTDSMAAAGAPDGDYSIAGNPATVRNGVARTPDGALAGSTLSMRKAVENLSAFCGITLTDAVICATANPASEVGLYEQVGKLIPGARADFLFCRPDEARHDLGISRIFVGGEEIRE